uniref:Phospho-2-dehydro-3-deoxyheptonate aldolase n=1 Tax=Oryza glumipatula TaxID=40148 RepID=A0A0E0A841_9ORYZ
MAPLPLLVPPPRPPATDPTPPSSLAMDRPSLSLPTTDPPPPSSVPAVVGFGAERIGAALAFRRREWSKTGRLCESWMPDPDLVQWTNVRLDVPLVLLLVVQSALEAWLRAAEFESSPAPFLPVTDVLDSPYMELAHRVDEALGFMSADGLTMDHPIMTIKFWTSHGCLLLPYEQALPENMRVKLPHLIRAVHVAVQIVTWVTDPMHGNTMKAPCGLKTRSFATFQYLLVPITSQ